MRNASLGWLLRRCRSYRDVDYKNELAAMNEATQAQSRRSIDSLLGTISAIKGWNSPTQTLTHDEYLGAMLGHRFCLIAAGDYTSTHKITEGTRTQV